MQHDAWNELSPLLDEALEMDTDARERWLDVIGHTRPGVERELRILLARDRDLESRQFLGDRSAVDLIGGAPLLAGQLVGDWVLERPIGQGGMGTVWLARRDDGRFEGTAAVKLLNLSLVGPASEARVRREASLLARLSHPGIARLLDAGVTGAGQPYLVLEYVDGERIDQYCDARRLTPPARLEIFRQVLDAVEHAHTHLIVHRDLKPSNMLVTANGVVKLLDFGIARLEEPVHEPGASPAAEQTNAGLTPEYASPEQVEGGPVTTTSDIYSLGVLLFRLLTGRHPTGEGARSPAEHFQALLQREPPRASEIVRSATLAHQTDAASHAAARASTPETLHRLYDGDLDTVIAKALCKAPVDRYATVAALREDLARYLRHEPVLARRASPAHRARKFVRRNRVAVIVGAATALSLLASTIITARGLREAQRERDKAVFAARRAEASSEFMSHLISYLSPSGKAFTMREVLDQGAQLLEKEYRQDPALVARMLMHFAGRYGEMGEWGRNGEVLARAQQLATSANDADVLTGALCGRADNLVFRDDLPGARAAYQEAMRVMARVPDPQPGLRVECMIAAADLADAEARPDSATAIIREAVRLLEAAGITNNTRYSSAVNELGLHLSSSGHPREAFESYQKSLDVQQRIGRDNTVGILATTHNVASAQSQMGEYLAADSLHDLVLQRWASVGVNGHVPPSTLRTNAAIHVALQRDDTAASQLERLIRLQGQPDVGRFVRDARVSLGTMRIRQGRLDEARALVAELGRAGGQPTASERVLQARLLRAQGQPDSALRVAARVLASAGYPSKAPTALEYPALLLAGETALDLQQLDLADRYTGDALTIARSNARAQNTSGRVGESLLLNARIRLARGDRAGAGRLATEALPSLTNGYGAAHPICARAQALIADAQR